MWRGLIGEVERGRVGRGRWVTGSVLPEGLRTDKYILFSQWWLLVDDDFMPVRVLRRFWLLSAASGLAGDGQVTKG